MNHVVPRASGHQQFFRGCLCLDAKDTLFFDYRPLIYAVIDNSFLLYYNIILIFNAHHVIEWMIILKSREHGEIEDRTMSRFFRSPFSTLIEFLENFKKYARHAEGSNFSRGSKSALAVLSGLWYMSRVRGSLPLFPTLFLHLLGQLFSATNVTND
jgi:hypothetical protein